MLIKKFAVVSTAIGFLSCFASAQVGVDGLLGGEWTGFTPKSAVFSASAPQHNFGSPTDQNHTVAYDIYFRADSAFVYGLALALPTSGDAYNAGLDFWNIYLDTNPLTASGSDLGFELQNNRAFIPGVAGYYNDIDLFGVVSAVTAGPSGGGVEFAIPISYLMGDPQGIGFQEIGAGNEFLRLNLSQAWGYSVIGGQSFYGSDRLGMVQVVPEPGTMAALGLGALALLRRRNRK